MREKSPAEIVAKMMSGAPHRGNRLELVRNESGLLQRQVADAMRTSVSTICRWEQGVRKPKFDEIKQLMLFYGKKFEELWP